MHEDQYLDAHMEDVINGGPWEDLWESEDAEPTEEGHARYDSDYWSYVEDEE